MQGFLLACLFVFAIFSFLCNFSQGHFFMSQVNTVFYTAGSITAMINSHQHKQVYLQENQLCFLVPLFCLGSTNDLLFQCVLFMCALPHTVYAWMPFPGTVGHPVDWVRHSHPATLGKEHL